ncbi:MAG: nodulation protein NfeD [Armatimonadetes bacterium]|nr:nodulation protein NfeD [Armatimonadota bacterium]
MKKAEASSVIYALRRRVCGLSPGRSRRMPDDRGRCLAALAVTLLVFSIAFVSAQGSRPLVKTTTINGPISPAAAMYVHRAIEIAEDAKAQALLVRLDTPGGLDDSMRAIIKDIFASEVPVIVYVSPKGARAASAGAIITIAAHVAAMAPGTAIGAAHPVAIGGSGGGGGESGGEKPKQDEVMSKKMEEDAAAYARSIAERRGRNIQWAEAAVRQSISSSATEAKNKNVIDLVAEDDKALLDAVDGRKVKLDSGAVTLKTKGARTEEVGQSLRERFLAIIGNPNVVLILMTIAIYGIIFELNNPGSIFPGIVGGIALILALFSFAILPVNTAGIALIVFAAALFIADLLVAGHGILSVGGVIAFVIGALILFETPSPVFRVSVSLVITLAVLTFAFFVFAVGSAIKAQKAKIVTGGEALMDRVVEARTNIDPKGKVFLEGSLWNAVSDGEPISEGELVRVVKVDGLNLHVRKET